MIERLLLWLERILRPPRRRVTDQRYPLHHWRIRARPFDQARDT